MIRKHGPALGAILLCAFAAAPTLGAPDAGAIMRKAGDYLRKAKTYQAKWRMVISMGDMGTMSMDMDIKTTSDGKAHVTTTPVGTPTGMMAMGAAMASTTTVSDGKTVYIYLKGLNSYQKMPATPNTNPGVQGVLGSVSQAGARYTYLRTEMVRGRKCHVIKVDVPPPPQAAGRGMTQDVQAFVDVATNRLQQIKTVVTMPGMGMGGAQQPGAGNQTPKPMKMTTTMVLVSEKLNAPIPAGTFKFVPPNGATEMKGGLPGAGMPGMGGPPGGAPAGPPR